MKSIENLLSKEILEKEYNNYKNLKRVAEKLNISVDSVRKYLHLFEIPYSKNQPRKYTCNDNIFKMDSEKSFYLAGFIAADGCVRIRKRKNIYSKILTIGLSIKDLDHLENIKKWFESDHIIKSVYRKPTLKAPKPGTNVILSMTSNEIVDDLQKFNIVPNKTSVYKFPTWLIGHPLVHHFMRGYFDGDGSISINSKNSQRIFTMMGTLNLVKNYQNILATKCETNINKIMKKDNIYVISYSGNNVNNKIYNFLYEDANLYLTRKKDKFFKSKN